MMLKPNLKLMAHQQDAVEFVVKNNGIGALFHEVGCGKTLSSLAIFNHFKQKEPLLKLLVICPISLIHGAWVKEIEKFTDYTWNDLHGKEYLPKSDIFLINFESLISDKKFKNLTENVLLGKWMIVIDESSKMKNHKAKTTEKILELKNKFIFRIICSGSPSPNIEWEYWPQIRFLNDNVLFNNFYKFRNTFFVMSRGKEIIPGAVYSKYALKEMFEKGYKYSFDNGKRDEFFNRIKPFCHMVKAKDCLDLPESIDEYNMVDIKDQQLKTYKEMSREYFTEIKSEISGQEDSIAVANIVLTKILRLRQITSGFITDANGNAVPVTQSNPKINALLDIVEQCGNEQIIIWCQFRWEIAQILTHLEKIAGVSQLHGGIKESDRINHVNDFISGKNRFLLAHPASASHGLTFVNCHFAIYYSFNYSFEEYTQSRGRIMRNGQKNHCVYFHIMVKDSVDGDVLSICQKKKDKQEVAEKWLKRIV